jgi:hypothetical protein
VLSAISSISPSLTRSVNHATTSRRSEPARANRDLAQVLAAAEKEPSQRVGSGTATRRKGRFGFLSLSAGSNR